MAFQNIVLQGHGIPRGNPGIAQGAKPCIDAINGFLSAGYVFNNTAACMHAVDYSRGEYSGTLAACNGKGCTHRKGSSPVFKLVHVGKLLKGKGT
jgi:hypothetical protein